MTSICLLYNLPCRKCQKLHDH